MTFRSEQISPEALDEDWEKRSQLATSGSRVAAFFLEHTQRDPETDKLRPTGTISPETAQEFLPHVKRIYQAAHDLLEPFDVEAATPADRSELYGWMVVLEAIAPPDPDI